MLLAISLFHVLHREGLLLDRVEHSCLHHAFHVSLRSLHPLLHLRLALLFDCLNLLLPLHLLLLQLLELLHALGRDHMRASLGAFERGLCARGPSQQGRPCLRRESKTPFFLSGIRRIRDDRALHSLLELSKTDVPVSVHVDVAHKIHDICWREASDPQPLERPVELGRRQDPVLIRVKQREGVLELHSLPFDSLARAIDASAQLE
mmetsp:Transcript_5705/g.9510  ORF Transcript_5705/g.9510 Transcript_5705/m.9510 type:complete len:206 (-) Transcript_5705:525-1142(-)